VARRTRRSPVPRPRPSLLLALRRRPRLWWLVAALAAAGAGALVVGAVDRAEAARRAWGEAVPVVVVQRARAAGETLASGDVAVEDRPAAVVPDGALRELEPGAVLRADVIAGEVLVAERLAGAGTSGPVARMPAGTRAVAVPAEPGMVPPVQPGDHVDVLAVTALDASGTGARGQVLVARALVVAADERTVTVAVPERDAPRVASALAVGAVVLALAGP